MHHLTTESRNPRSRKIDELSAIEIAKLINDEDAQVAAAVGQVIPSIATAIEWTAEAFRKSGRLFYIGAGTSGRLGVLDASECPPTFSTPPGMVIGVIAGGSKALTTAVEGAEDDLEQGARDLQAHQFSSQDLLVGIATSGRTPYVIGALNFARSLGSKTIGLTCNAQSELHQHAELMLAPVVGPEVLSGSTRLKSGTATKLILNMITTGAMILIGKTYGNLMVDLRASNVKLKLRSQRIVSEITGLDLDQSAIALQNCADEVKTAIVSVLRNVTADQARELLERAGGQLRRAITDVER
ncbi:MAG: N-acetylmuramic acid 6-phosphate etherase [Pirellulales bacterium]